MIHRVLLMLMAVFWGLTSCAKSDKVYTIPSDKVEKYRENVCRALEVHYYGLKDLVSEDEEMVMGRDAYRADFLKNNLVTGSRTFTPEFLFRRKGQESVCDAEQYLLELQKEFAGTATGELEFTVSEVSVGKDFYQPDGFSCYAIVDYTLSVELEGRTKAKRRCRAYCLFPTAISFNYCKLWQVQPVEELTAEVRQEVAPVKVSETLVGDTVRITHAGTAHIVTVPKAETSHSKAKPDGMSRKEMLALLNRASEQYAEGDYKESVRLFLLLADKGDAVAQNYLAECYLNGHGLPKDTMQAFRWLWKSARQGYSVADNKLHLFSKGCVMDRTTYEDTHWEFWDYVGSWGFTIFFLLWIVGGVYGYMEEKNKDWIWFSLAGLVLGGIGVFVLYNHYQTVGTPQFQLMEEMTTAFEKNKELAEQGDAAAQFDVAQCYRQGYVVKYDADQAFEWFQKAAEQGHTGALNALGDAFYYGMYGVDKNLDRALDYYTRAAEQGDMEAQHSLGYCLMCGIGTQKDMKQAVIWYQKAADQQHASAFQTLSTHNWWDAVTGCEDKSWKAREIYREERLVMAFQYCLKAALQGLEVPQYNLADCYWYGKGTPKDEKAAFYWYQQAAWRGYQYALFEVAERYYYGNGVEQDRVLAGEWYVKAAQTLKKYYIDKPIPSYYLNRLKEVQKEYPAIEL